MIANKINEPVKVGMLRIKTPELITIKLTRYAFLFKLAHMFANSRSFRNLGATNLETLVVKRESVITG